MSAILAAQRRVTRGYIDADPTTVTLIPSTVTVLANGGKSQVDGIPRTPQRFKLIQVAFDARPTLTVDGVERIISYILLGTHDSTMEVWDHWSGDDGSVYTIVALGEGFGYEKKGLVERHLPGG